MSNVDEWTITVRATNGQGTVQVDVDDAWARLWRRASVAGQPTGQWVGIGFRLAGTPYSLGFMAVSSGGRLLWFPTANLQAILYDEDASGQLTNYLGRPVDHLTLNPADSTGRHRSHFTYVDGGHGPNVSHHAKPGYLIPWFSVMLPNIVDHLRLVPAELSITFPPVRTDEQYPSQLVGDGRWLVVEGNDPPDVPCLVQFDIWAGVRPEWIEDAWNYLPIPHLLGIGDKEGPDIRHRSIGVRVAEDHGVVIIMSWVPGRLDRPRILRPSSFDPGDTPPLRIQSS